VFTLATVLEDKPLSVQTPVGLWEPDNYDGRFRGPVTLREAIEGSLNVPFARLGMAVGPDNIVATAVALGIQDDLNPVLSLALGSSEVTPLELTAAYNVLAAGGYRATPNSILGILDRDGRLIGRQERDGQQVFEPAEAYLITSALRGAVERGTGSSLRSLGFRGPVAAKSGTTNNFRDAWFIGYTPTLTVGVWVGFDDGRRMGISGSRAALPIFGQLLVDAQGTYGDGEFRVPYGLEVAEVNRETGLLGGPGCRGETEVFLRGTAPETSCSTRRWSTRRYYSGDLSLSNIRIAPLLRELERRATRGSY
jgi:membrane carboxypeptidase/penicillin-binding protein